jgi:hypothetical protein
MIGQRLLALDIVKHNVYVPINQGNINLAVAVVQHNPDSIRPLDMGQVYINNLFAFVATVMDIPGVDIIIVQRLLALERVKNNVNVAINQGSFNLAFAVVQHNPDSIRHLDMSRLNIHKLFAFVAFVMDIPDSDTMIVQRLLAFDSVKNNIDLWIPFSDDREGTLLMYTVRNPHLHVYVPILLDNGASPTLNRPESNELSALDMILNSAELDSRDIGLAQLMSDRTYDSWTALQKLRGWMIGLR